MNLKFNLPENTLLAYKALPTHTVTEAIHLYSSHAQRNELHADWSAFYAQFDPDHTLRYVPNHYDRGHEKAMLVSMTTRRPLEVCVIRDDTFKRPDIDAKTKADLIRNWIDEVYGSSLSNQPDRPLMKAIGEDLNLILVLYDAVDLECVIPHQMVTHDNFDIRPVVLFDRDDKLAYRTKSYWIEGEQFQCTREEKEDICALARTLLNERLSLPVAWQPPSSSD